MTRADAALPTLGSEIETTMTSEHILRLAGHLQGKLLTLIEAVLGDNEQKLEATKSLIKESLWSDIEIVTKWMAEQKDGRGSTFPL